MDHIRIAIGALEIVGRLEKSRAPQTCRSFERLLPFEGKVIQAVWSGEALWVPWKGPAMSIVKENVTGYPSEGQLLFVGGENDPGLLLAYGNTRFMSRYGQRLGNHFLTIISGQEHLAQAGQDVLWKGAQAVLFTKGRS